MATHGDSKEINITIPVAAPPAAEGWTLDSRGSRVEAARVPNSAGHTRNLPYVESAKSITGQDGDADDRYAWLVDTCERVGLQHNYRFVESLVSSNEHFTNQPRILCIAFWYAESDPHKLIDEFDIVLHGQPTFFVCFATWFAFRTDNESEFRCYINFTSCSNITIRPRPVTRGEFGGGGVRTNPSFREPP